MDPATRGLLATYIAQVLIGLVQAGIFWHFSRLYRQQYLADWTFAFVAQCAYQAAAAMAVALVALGSSSLEHRLLWSWLSQVAAYLQVTFLLLGSLGIGDRPPLRRTHVARWVMLAVLMGTTVTLAYAFSESDVAARLLLRLGLKLLVGGVAFLVTAWLLLRRHITRKGLGARFVAIAFALYGLAQLIEFSFFLWHLAHGRRLPGAEHLGLLDLVVQVSIGFGLIIWVADEERRRADQATHEVEWTRSVDASTGLPNRQHGLGLLEADLQARQGEDAWAVLTVELTNLEAVSKTLGVEVAESVAIQAAARLSREQRWPGQRVARAYANRFLVTVPRIDDNSSLDTLAQALLADVQQPYTVDDTAVSVSAAVGIAVFPEDGTSAELLVHRAEIAAQGVSMRVAYYSEERERHARRRVELAGEVRDALTQGNLVAYLQPIVCSETHAVTGFEVLARWRHAQRGVLLPMEFLGVLEECGLLPELDLELLRSSCQWAAAQSPVPTLSVNVSSNTFEQAGFSDQVRQALLRSGLPPHCLQIEITESTALANVVRTRAILGALREKGVRVALDDFGTGFSSLAQLRDLPVDVLKIDRSFVQAALHDPKTGVIVESIAQLARKLGLEVVAEGVEGVEQLRHCQGLGVTHVQGFYFSAAIEPAAASRLVGGTLGSA